jgi:hypothetical protein
MRAVTRAVTIGSLWQARQGAKGTSGWYAAPAEAESGAWMLARVVDRAGSDGNPQENNLPGTGRPTKRELPPR